MGQINQNGEYPIEGGHMDGQSIKYRDPPDYFKSVELPEPLTSWENGEAPCNIYQTEVLYQRHIRGTNTRWWYVYILAE